MKVLKVENHKTSEIYFIAVEDNDNRIDPAGLFSASFMTISNRHKKHNVTATVLVANTTKEQASVEVIKQRKLNPSALSTKPQVDAVPVAIKAVEPKIITPEVKVEVVEKPTEVQKDKEIKSFEKSKKD